VLGERAAAIARRAAAQGHANIALAPLAAGVLGGAFAATGAENQSPSALLSVHISGGSATDPAVAITPAPLRSASVPNSRIAFIRTGEHGRDVGEIYVTNADAAGNGTSPIVGPMTKTLSGHRMGAKLRSSDRSARELSETSG